MRKLIVSTYVTLDGVIQPLDWSGQSTTPEAHEERGAFARDMLFEADALVMGRETYEIFAGTWPTRSAADDGPGEAGYIDRINAMKKHVASTTLRAPLAWNADLIDGDVGEAVAGLKQQDGMNILMYGCGPVARALQERGLIDEYLFWVYPVVRGQGTRLFDSDLRADLELVDTRPFAAGFSVLTCVPRQKA